MRVILASAHRYADLARLWHRFALRDLVPALRAAGAGVEVVLFRDAAPAAFDARDFPGATLLAPGPGARDFIEFYDAALRRESDVLFLLDADLFVLDGAWAASFLSRFADPAVAAVSLLRRSEQPGVYALLAQTAAYRELPAPVLAPSYEAPGAGGGGGGRAAIARRWPCAPAAGRSSTSRRPRPRAASPTSTARP